MASSWRKSIFLESRTFKKYFIIFPVRGLLVLVPEFKRRSKEPSRKRLPVQDADAGPGSPPRDACSHFRSVSPAAGPRPTLKGRSTLRSVFASITPSVQWEDTRYPGRWGGGGPDALLRTARLHGHPPQLPSDPSSIDRAATTP